MLSISLQQFISKLLGPEAEKTGPSINHSLTSRNREIKSYPIHHCSSDNTIEFVEPPGFGNSEYETDDLILEDLIKWLRKRQVYLEVEHRTCP